jgi:hypothetical protein
LSPIYKGVILINLYYILSFIFYNTSKEIFYYIFFFIIYNFYIFFEFIYIIFGADTFEIKIIKNKKKNPEEARDETIKKKMEKIINIYKRIKNIKKEKSKEAGKKFKFIIKKVIKNKIKEIIYIYKRA